MVDVPTSLGWTIRQTPTSRDEPELDMVRRAHLYALILGNDIQAPVGLEWQAAQQSGVTTLLFYHAALRQTRAAQSFMRLAAQKARWHAFCDLDDLCRQALRHMVDHLLAQRIAYALDDAEVERLRAWRAKLDALKFTAAQGRSVAGAGAVVIGVERFLPSQGKLIGAG